MKIKDAAAVALGRKGGQARAKALTAAERQASARKAGKANGRRCAAIRKAKAAERVV